MRYVQVRIIRIKNVMTKYDTKTYNVRPVCYHNNKQNEGGSYAGQQY